VNEQEGLYVIDKIPGPTSFDVVRDLKRLVGNIKVGHTGSLDPFASGVLVCLTGKATKLSGILLNADKRYRGVAKLGEATDTLDCTGTLTETAPVPQTSFEEVDAVVRSFQGEWAQVPPTYSAKKRNGVRLYELARQQIHVRCQPVPVHLYDVHAVKWDPPFLHFEVHCSKGTYVRSLAEEIGRKLGSRAHLSELRRSACGVFNLEESTTLENLQREDGKAYRERAFQNYLRLLRMEGLVRRPVGGSTQPPEGRPRDVQGGRGSAADCQSRLGRDTSWLNYKGNKEVRN